MRYIIFALALCVACMHAHAAIWHKANLTTFTSYPEEGGEECIAYSGCKTPGEFEFLEDKQSEEWVRTHNIAAVLGKDADKYRLKTLRIRSGKRIIDVVVYDTCADADCDGCCTRNARDTGFLIDLEKNTMERFDIDADIVEWMCLDC